MIDLAIIFVIAVSGALAYWRGFTREVLALASLLGAAAAARETAVFIEPALSEWITNPRLAKLTSYAIIFTFVLIIATISSIIISRNINRSLLGPIDRLFGAAFGFIRGALVVLACYVAAGWLAPVQEWPDTLRTAKLRPFLDQGVAVVSGLVPPDYQHYFEPNGALGSPNRR